MTESAMLFGAEDLVRYWRRADARAILRNLKWFLPVALVLAILGPFDTSLVPFAVRLGYWSLLTGGLAFAMPPATRLVSRWTSGLELHWSVAAGAVWAVAAVPITVAVLILDWIMGRWIAPLFEYDGVSSPPQLDPGGLLLLYLSVWLTIALIAGGVSFFSIPRSQIAARPETGALAGLRFLSRLPARIGGDIVSIRVEDHYLRVTTSEGETLLLMRLRDALAELEGYPGMQVHRSWWVASKHVRNISKEARRLIIELSNGARVPVSGTFRANVERLVS